MKMTKSKMFWMRNCTTLLLFLAGLGAPPAARSAVGDWSTFSSMYNVQETLLVDSVLWCATDGGLLKLNTATGEMSYLTNVDGLATIELSALAIDTSGALWIGHTDGRINVFDPQTNSWETIKDYWGIGINALALRNDSLFVGLDIGVSLYLTSRREVKESYKKIGDFQAELPIRDILLSGSNIYAATDSGVGISSFRLVNLLAPESWTISRHVAGLSSFEVHSLAEFQGQVFAGTSKGPVLLEGEKWNTLNSGMGQKPVYTLAADQFGLYAGTPDGVFVYEGGVTWRQLGSLSEHVTAISPVGGLSVWAGLSEDGTSYYDAATNSWTSHLPDTPAGNSFIDMRVDQKGVLWSASGLTAQTGKGVYAYDGANWRTIRAADGLPTERNKAIEVDHRNRKWVGTFGKGVVIIDDSTADLRFTTLGDGYFAPPDLVNTDFFAVYDVRRDQFNNMWMINYNAVNGQALVCATPDNQWRHFGTSMGMNHKQAWNSDFDEQGRVWVATQGGISVLDYGESVLDQNDDDFTGSLTTADGLETVVTTAVAVGKDGVVWIGTPSGLYFWSGGGGVQRKYGAISDDILVIEVDIRNNKWIGTSGGLSVLGPDNWAWTHYTAETSPLVNNAVISFAFDSESGDTYIGTTHGLSRLSTGNTTPRDDLKALRVFPNPLDLTQPNAALKFFDLADESQIKIFTSNGHLVRHLADDAIRVSQAVWDGTNDQGEQVASGVYIYVVYVEDKESSVGKVAVIR